MKKILLIALCTSIIPIISCTGKKDRLAADTLVIAIDPKTIALYTGDTKTLTAIIKDAKSNDLNATADWSLEPASLGTLSSTHGKTTKFTPAAAGTSGKVHATYSSITASADITVKNNGGGSLKYALLTDTQAAADLTRDGSNAVIFNYFDTDGAPPWQMTAADAFPGCPVDPVKCTRLDYTSGTGLGFGGFYLALTAAKDISAFTNFTFYVKGSVGGEKFKVGLSDGTDVKLNVPNYLTSGVTTSWQKVTIPLSDFAGLNKAAVTKPLIVAFEDAYTGSSVTVYIDCIGFE